MDSNVRPESMARITTPELAKQFIDEQVAEIPDEILLILFCVCHFITSFPNSWSQARYARIASANVAYVCFV